MSNRRLWLLRHSKSSWKFPELADHDRPLNKRGRRDSLRMSDHLANRAKELDCIFTSSAERAKVFAQELSLASNVELAVVEQLYTFSDQVLLSFLNSINDGLVNIAIVGHNPAITYLSNRLCGAEIPNVPTSGLVLLESSAKWSEFSDGCGQLINFEYPKSVYDQ